MTATAINPTTIDRLYILSILYEESMILEPSLGITVVQAENIEKAKSKFLDKFNEIYLKEYEEDGFEDPYEPYDSFEELSCNEFVEWSISVVINQESEVIDFSGDSKYYQKSFMDKYPGIEL